MASNYMAGKYNGGRASAPTDRRQDSSATFGTGPHGTGTHVAGMHRASMRGTRSGAGRPSLSQDAVVRWKRGLGVGLTGRAPRALSGRSGLAQFSDWAIATAADPSGFEALSYQRTLSMLRVYAQLATPYRLTRGVEAGRGTSGEVVVVVNGLRACTHVRVGDQIGALRPGQMAVNPADTPFTLWTTSVTDPTILLVREETLGVVDAVLPGDSASLLPRTVAAFVQRFVADAATANRPVDAEAERIVIELLRATVTQHSGQVGRHLSSSAAVVRQRARDDRGAVCRSGLLPGLHRAGFVHESTSALPTFRRHGDDTVEVDQRTQAEVRPRAAQWRSPDASGRSGASIGVRVGQYITESVQVRVRNRAPTIQ